MRIRRRNLYFFFIRISVVVWIKFPFLLFPQICVHNVLLGSSQFPMLSVDTVFVFEFSLSQSSVWSLKQKRGRKKNLGHVCSSNSVQNKNSNQIHRSVSENTSFEMWTTTFSKIFFPLSRNSSSVEQRRNMGPHHYTPSDRNVHESDCLFTLVYRFGIKTLFF